MNREFASGLSMTNIRTYEGQFRFVEADDRFVPVPGRTGTLFMHQRMSPTTIGVLATFETKVLVPEKEVASDGPVGGQIRASFEIAYSNDAFEDCDDAEMIKFVYTSAVYHAWPYWREFLTQACHRLGIQTILAPTLTTDAAERIVASAVARATTDVDDADSPS